MDNQIKTYNFHVHGMHCKACELSIESELRDVPYVTFVDAKLATHSVEVRGYFGDMGDIEVAETLTKFIDKHGYSLSIEKQIKEKKWAVLHQQK